MPVLFKDPVWSRVYAVDFTNFTEIAGGDTIATVNSITSSPAGLTVGAGSISGGKVKFNVSGGTLGQVYTLTVQITTAAGAILTGVCHMQIQQAQG